MKILQSNYISPFGGLNFVLEAFDRHRVGQRLDSALPPLPAQCHYSWRDIFYSFASIFFCGGDCIEDIAEHMSGALGGHPDVRLPSPDTVLRRMKSLAREKELCTTDRGTKEHSFSIHELLNRINIRLIKSHLLEKGTASLILDYDNTLIETQKADATYGYKGKSGYDPGVAFIGDKVVYVENRSGHSSDHILQEESLKRMFDLLEEEGISPSVFRADGASFYYDILKEVCSRVETFYIRARLSPPVHRAIRQIEEWKPVRKKAKGSNQGEESYYGSIAFTPFQDAVRRDNNRQALPTCRLVVTKTLRKDRQIDMFSGEAYEYSAILTNEENLTEEEVEAFYNRRGAAERQFDVLKNDFGWGKLPFSKLEHNTVFLLFTAMCRNLYALLIGEFSRRFEGLQPHYRIKKFIFRFICIPGKWVYRSRGWKLRLYGKIAFKT